MPDMLAKGVRWFDDWFSIQQIDEGLWAIGEPRFHQINWNYLVAGNARALLFDTGPGVRDISVVVKALTNLPVTALPSHMHFDHTGNLHRFDDLAMADLPQLRIHEKDGLMQEPGDLFLGHFEGMAWRAVAVRHWWPIGHIIELGGRQLEILDTPGHAAEHVALWDHAHNILLAADFLYLGALWGQTRGANLADYERVTEALLQRMDGATQIFGAHGQANERDQHAAPKLAKQDAEDLLKTLKSLKKSGEMPGRVEVNKRMYLLTAPHAFAAWQKP